MNPPLQRVSKVLDHVQRIAHKHIDNKRKQLNQFVPRIDAITMAVRLDLFLAQKSRHPTLVTTY